MFWTVCGKFATDLSNLQSLCTREKYLIKDLFVLRVNDLRTNGELFLAEMSKFHSSCQDEVLRINKNFRAKQNSSSIDLGNPVKKNSFGEFFQSVAKKDTYMSRRSSWWKIIFFERITCFSGVFRFSPRLIWRLGAVALSRVKKVTFYMSRKLFWETFFKRNFF